MARSTLSRLAAAVLVSVLPATQLVFVRDANLLASAPRFPEANADADADSPAPLSGARDPSWSPDGALIAVSLLDQIWVMTRDGQSPRALVSWDGNRPAIERDPAWSADGARVAFAADRGDGFDLYVVPITGGTPERVTFLPGDERWPAWTPDNRIVFAHRAVDQWDLARVLPAIGTGIVSRPEPLTDTPFDETEPRVSPDGARVLFVSNRDNDASETDLWTMPLEKPQAATASVTPNEPPAAAAAIVMATPPPAPTPATTEKRPALVRVLRARGVESSPAWAPDGRRIAFSAMRSGIGSLWVAEVDLPGDAQAPPRPVAPPQLVSRRGGQVAWSPDGRALLVADMPDPDPIYNGNPRRDAGDAPPLFALGSGFRLRLLPAPRPPDEGEAALNSRVVLPATRWLSAFEVIWGTLRTLYYDEGANADAWKALHDLYAPRAAAARDEASLEAVVDDLVAEQPLIKPQITSHHAMVVSAHRLASEAGTRILSRGGNIVDAAIAVSLTLGVVEPDASGLGGDGMAILYLKGMKQPAVIDFKDQTPIHATLDNAALLRDGRLVADGAAAANIPGLLAGLDMLYQKYGSKRLRWDELVAPAIRHADEGFVLDETLPTSIAEGQSLLRKYEASRTLFLPNGRVPRAGDRFVNHDLAATLRTIAAGGATEFYQGALARRIATDMAENGGIIGYDDLAQYRAVEREPVSGRYRDHVIYSTPPPVSSGASLVETLQILDHFKPRNGTAATATTASKDADYFHYLIEATKVRHTLREIADPALWPVNLSPHLDYAHAGELFQQINPKRSAKFRPDADQRDDGSPTGGSNGNGSGNGNGNGGVSGGASGGANVPNGADAASDDRIGRGTTAFVVADSDGNMIAITQTLSTWGGSFYVSKGLGFLYNNHLRSSRMARGTVGQLLPLMRSSSTNAPTLVFRELNGVRTPRLAVGAAGNAWIVPSIYAVLTNILDAGLSTQAAVEAPRFLLTRDPADPSGTQPRVQIEDRFNRTVLQDLMHRGHVFQKIGRKGEVRYGYASAATIDLDTHTVTGGADPRRSHSAIAWDGRSQ
jgi:gamma-glutamyltranspeptidase/glutathione hydrolase